MRKSRKSKGNTKQIIVIGFLVLYVVGMFLTTFLVKEQYEMTSRTVASYCTQDMMADIEDVELVYNEDGSLGDYSLDYMQYILSKSTAATDQYGMISAGLLDTDGNLIAKTSDCFYPGTPSYVNGEPQFSMIDFSEYFTEEEMDKIREYYVVERQKKYAENEKGYSGKVSYDEENGKLVHFFIKDSEVKKNDEGSLIEVYYEPVFRWTNPEYTGSEEHYFSFDTNLDYYMHFPYLEYGEEYWNRWKNDAHLQNYMEGTTNDNSSERYQERTFYENEVTYLNYIYIGNNKEKVQKQEYEPDYLLVTNVKTYAWEAAVAKLKEIYIYAACFVAICMAIVLYLTDKVYKKQAQLDETRRDFTNAVAHELKTPLAIVRGLVENMERENSEEKNAYYRLEAIRQTEVMDGLVKEMLFISKMNSDDMTLKKEQVSFSEIIKEQMTKLETLIEEKNLKIQYWNEGDLVINGDRSYLEKAVFNLLENAVSHNRPEGMISIKIDSNAVVIENTATLIPEEDLPHVCEMFFTGNKSRNVTENHVGLGLYLAKRIFDLHGLELQIGNTDVGVRVEVK